MILESIVEYVVSSLIDKHKDMLPDRMVNLMTADDSLDALLKKKILPKSLDALKADYPELQKDEDLTEQIIAPAIAHVIYQTVFSGDLSDAAAVQAHLDKLLAHDLTLSQQHRLRNLLDSYSEHFRRELAQHQNAGDVLVMQALSRFRAEVLTRLDVLTEVSGPAPGTATRYSKPRIFISYARADASDFVQRLYDDLEKRDIDVWLDKRDMASGNTFIDEISRAIQDAGYFLLIFTPGAIKSQYCRDEWKKALEYYKPIIPLLLIGDYRDLPKEAFVYLNDTPDFRSENTYTEALEKLAKQIRNVPRPVGKLLGDIPSVKDSAYVSRLATEEALRHQLTGHKTTVNENFPGVVGLHGMGGVGKTALTMALAHDYFIRRTFSDGVFLLNMGDLDEAGGIAYKWAQFSDFLDKPRQFSRLDDARAFFQRETADKELLLILDDVWDSEYIEGFTRLGKNCRLLITTRKADVLPNKSFVYQLVEMDEQQAVELMAKISGLPREKLPPVAYKIIDFCGRLPLALSLIGAKLRTEGFAQRIEAWQDIFNALQEIKYDEIAARTDYTHPNLYKAIHASIRDLDTGLWERYLDFAIFSSDTNIPIEVLYTLWQPTPSGSVRQTVSELVNRSFLQRTDDGSYKIHDLLLAYIRDASTDIAQKHNRLLDQYNPNHLPWHEITDDGYIYDNLIYHLVHASRRQQVMDLFSSPHWLNKRAVDEIPYYHKYLNDIQKAKEAYTTSDIMDIPARVTLSFVERSVRAVFDEIPKELPEFLIVMKNDIEKVIIPLALMQSYRGKQVEYLEEIGKNLLSIGDYKNAERTFLLAADNLLGMSNSEIMSETSADQLWNVQSLFVTTGCALARFGKTDQRVFARLQEISQVRSEDGEYVGVLYRGAIDIAKALAEHGHLNLSLETLELALNHAPKEYRNTSLKTSHIKEIANALISGKHFDLAEKLLAEFDPESIDIQDLWGKYLRTLNEEKEWLRFQAVWKKISTRYPTKLNELQRLAHSFRTGMDVDRILSLSTAEIHEQLQNRNQWDEYQKQLKNYRIFYATRFDVHVRQGHFTEAEKDIDILQELKQIDDTSGIDKHQQLKTWATIQNKIAFQLLNLEEEGSSYSRRYSESLAPSLVQSSSTEYLMLSLATQKQFDLLEKLAQLGYPQIDSGAISVIQSTLKLKDIRGWELLPVDFSEGVSKYSHDQMMRIGYSFMAFREGVNQSDLSVEHLDQIKQQGHDVFVAYVQGVALREGIEKGLALLNESFSDSHQEWDRVRHGFSLARPFILLKSPEEAETALNQCFELIWDKDPGRNLLTSLFWRLSTQLKAEELATQMDKYIKRDLYGLKEVVGFAKDMLFLDEGYSRHLIISLLRLQIPKPHFRGYSSDLFREENNFDISELDPEIVRHLERELGVGINSEALNLLRRAEEFLSRLSLQMMFPAFDFSRLIMINQGKIRISMHETVAETPSEDVITNLLLILEKLEGVEDRGEQEYQYQYFPVYVLSGNLWMHHYPQIHEILMSRLIEMTDSILPRMQFDVEFRVLIFAQFLSLVANRISGQKALQILDQYLQYLNDNPLESDTFFSRSNMLPYILVAAPVGKEREELLREHLAEIDHLNILLEMFAYFDADGDINAANIIMSVLMEKAATTDISLPPTPDWSSNSWDPII